MGNIKIVSDFSDYYDTLSNDKSTIIYNRNISYCMQRGVALNFLKDRAIKTLELKPVSQFNSWDNKIVVYKDPRLHHGLGKEILDVTTAKSMYTNCLASRYTESDDLKTIKFLQIGKRRFTLTFEKEPLSLDKGNIIDISESSSEYNMVIRYPIFSIDYISVNRVMIATDFNEVENLHSLNFENQLNAEQVTDEIEKALIIYNKI